MGDRGDIVLTHSTMMTTTIASIAVSLSSHAHATSLTTLTTGSVGADERGAILGLEHGLFSMARIAGPKLGTTMLSRGPSIFGFYNIAVDGLWRVICVCVLLDVALLTLLKTWTTRQNAMAEAELKMNTDTSFLLKSCDHDHSD